MYPQLMIIELLYPQNIPIIDTDFDSFELNNDLGDSVCTQKPGTFYHNALGFEK